MGRSTTTAAVIARVGFALVVLAAASAAAVLSLDYGDRARLAPLLTSVPLIALMAVVIVRELLTLRAAPPESGPSDQTEPADPGESLEGTSLQSTPARTHSAHDARAAGTAAHPPVQGTYLQAVVSLVILLVLFYVLGSITTAIIYPPLHLAIVGRFSIRASLAVSAVSAGLIWLVVDTLLNVNLYSGLL